MGEPFIHLAAVQKIYRTRRTDFLAISEATFDVEAGELVSLVGGAAGPAPQLSVADTRDPRLLR